MNASKAEPMPITTEQSTPVVPHTMELLGNIGREVLGNDLLARARAGELHYGTPLMSHNGRNSMVDLYQELLDALNYLAQYQLESGEDISIKFTVLKQLAMWVRISLTYEAQTTAREPSYTPSACRCQNVACRPLIFV